MATFTVLYKRQHTALSGYKYEVGPFYGHVMAPTAKEARAGMRAEGLIPVRVRLAVSEGQACIARYEAKRA